MATPYDFELIAGTITQGTSPYQGLYCLGLQGASAEVRQRIPLEQDLMSQVITFKGMVKGKIADAPKLRITIGSTNYDSATVTVDDASEELSITATPADAVQPIYIKLIVTGGTNPAYFDYLRLTVPKSPNAIPVSEAFGEIDQLFRRPVGSAAGVPWSELDKPDYPVDGYSRLPFYLDSSYQMRLVGRGVWSTLTDGDETIDLNSDQIAVIAIRAGLRTLAMAKGADHQSDVAHWDRVEKDLLADEVMALKRLNRPGPVHRSVPGSVVWR